MKKEYVELDGVVFLAPEGDLFTKKAVGGKWVPSGGSARAKTYGTPIEESEARKRLGDAFPEMDTDKPSE